jgi:hypothetical protein
VPPGALTRRCDETVVSAKDRRVVVAAIGPVGPFYPLPPQLRWGPRYRAALLLRDEVLGLRVMTDKRAGGLLGLVLPARVFATRDADAIGAE